MAAVESELPETRWELPAPESQVLLEGPGSSPSQTLKLALLELVVRRALRLETVKVSRALLWSKELFVLAPGATDARSVSRSLASVLEVYAGMPKRTFGGSARAGGVTGVLVADLAKAMRRACWSSRGYVRKEVFPALVERGLYAREWSRRLGVVPAPRWERTPAGAAARSDLERRLAVGRGLFAVWADQDPARAEGFVRLAGSSVLLMRDLHPEIQRLRRQRERQRRRDEGVIVEIDGDGVGRRPENDDRSDQDGPPEADPVPLDLDRVWDHLDLGAFDRIDAAFDAISAEVDSGGGDGGDGDGGDGGE